MPTLQWSLLRVEVAGVMMVMIQMTVMMVEVTTITEGLVILEIMFQILITEEIQDIMGCFVLMQLSTMIRPTLYMSQTLEISIDAVPIVLP